MGDRTLLGGHLALHLLVAHPERLLGVVCVDALGAFDVFAELGANMQRRLSPDEIARAEEIQAKRAMGEATEQEIAERWAIMWPQYFLREELASAPPRNVGPQCSLDRTPPWPSTSSAGRLSARGDASPYNRSLHLADRSPSRIGADRGDPRLRRPGLCRL